MSYIESLEPGSSVGATYANFGALLDPLKSKQYELGIKTEQDGWAATAALSHREEGGIRECRQRAGAGRQDALSGVGAGRLHAYRPRLERGRQPDVAGFGIQERLGFHRQPRGGAPKFVAAAQLAYSVPQVPGLKLRADVKYTGNTMLGASNRVQVDDYAIVNIGATYDTQIHGYEATFTAGINNVANKALLAVPVVRLREGGRPADLWPDCQSENSRSGGRAAWRSAGFTGIDRRG